MVGEKEKNRYKFQFCITKAWLLYTGFCGECGIQRMSNRENIGRLRSVSICYSFINFWLMHAHDVLTFSFLHLMLCIIESGEIYCCCYLHVDEQNTEQHETEATIWSLHLSFPCVCSFKILWLDSEISFATAVALFPRSVFSSSAVVCLALNVDYGWRREQWRLMNFCFSHHDCRGNLVCYLIISPLVFSILLSEVRVDENQEHTQLEWQMRIKRNFSLSLKHELRVEKMDLLLFLREDKTQDETRREKGEEQ